MQLDILHGPWRTSKNIVKMCRRGLNQVLCMVYIEVMGQQGCYFLDIEYIDPARKQHV